MKKIIAVNASPRKEWNTGTMIREAAKGAESAGAEVRVYDLYKLEKFTGCISCFGCKRPEHSGKCICRDGLAPVLEDIRTADVLFSVHRIISEMSPQAYVRCMNGLYSSMSPTKRNHAAITTAESPCCSS